MTTPEAFLRLPKVELHMHVAGSVRPATIRELVAADELRAALADEYRAAERGEGLPRTLARFAAWDATVRTPERLHRVMTELCEDMAEDGVVYAEARLRPAAGDDEGRWDAMMEAAAEAVGAFSTPRVRFLGVLLRGSDPGFAEREARRAVSWAGRGLVGLDIAGDETAGGAEPLVRAMAIAREAGLKLSTHAGETNAEAVRQALDWFSPDRIAHGVHAEQDPDVVAELRDRRIHLEMAINSNYLVGTVPDFASHPFARFLRQGLSVGLNTDNRTICGTTLSEDYARAARELGLTRHELARATVLAAEATYLPPDEKAALVAEVRRGWDAAGS